MNAMLKSALGIVTLAATVSAQVPEPDFRKMTWSFTGPITWLASKIFQYAGDYGYYQDNNPSYGISNTDPLTDRRHWRYVYYTGLAAKRIVAWGSWGLPSIPAPFVDAQGVRRDGCGHTHVTYGVWMQYGYYSGGTYYTGWVGPLNGGSLSGVRVNNYTCSHQIGASAHASWGSSAFTFDFPKTGNIWQALVLGGVANSHGAGLCGGTFACINQPWLGAYTVPY